MTAFRDDLEAALQRTDDLERDMAALRERNQRIAAQIERGDLNEAQDELEARAAEESALAEYHNRPTQLQATRGGRLATSILVGTLGFIITSGLSANGMNAGAMLTLISFGGFVMWLNVIPRVDPPRRIK